MIHPQTIRQQHIAFQDYTTFGSVTPSRDIEAVNNQGCNHLRSEPRESAQSQNYNYIWHIRALEKKFASALAIHMSSELNHMHWD